MKRELEPLFRGLLKFEAKKLEICLEMIVDCWKKSEDPQLYLKTFSEAVGGFFNFPKWIEQLEKEGGN